MIAKNLACDCHVHVTPDGKWFDTDIDASLGRLLEELSDSPIKKVVLLPVGKGEDELRNATNLVISLINRYPDSLMGFSAYYPDLDVNQVIESKLNGIKIHPRLNKLDILNNDLVTFYEAADRKGLPILFDAYCTPISDMALEQIRPLVYSKIAAAFPSLKIILAHCGMPFIWEAYTVLKWYENVFSDLSQVLEYFKSTYLVSELAWVVRKIPYKFIYGSDFPEMGLNSYFQEFETFCKNYDISSKEIINNFYRVISDASGLSKSFLAAKK
jgi:predicted TIM-barrel fold metal-dependent hydrolase